ncbi:KNOX1 [Dillenia turbinata]|uniref:KNOX1 n=1 Tax=Dillenia turbinata TaxID=194707 RepID=A0AAN8V3F1_9MAGN
MEDEIYSLHSLGNYSAQPHLQPLPPPPPPLMPPENLLSPANYPTNFQNQCIFRSDHHHRQQQQLYSSSVASDAVSMVAAEDNLSSTIRAKISSHPLYPSLLQAYIDCQKVGAPPEIASLLDEITRKNELCRRNAVVSSCFGADPELDEFMGSYCDILMKYKSDLEKPFDEATTFLNKIESQLNSLCNSSSSRSYLSGLSLSLSLSLLCIILFCRVFLE